MLLRGHIWNPSVARCRIVKVLQLIINLYLLPGSLPPYLSSTDYCSRNPACKAVCTKPPAQLCPYSGRAPVRSCPASSKGGRKRRCQRSYTTGPSNPCNCKQPSKCVKACPDGRAPTPCLIDPCNPLISPCNPDEQCTADYCSSTPCKAICTKADKGPCPDGSQPVLCNKNPCDDPSACPQGETCTPDYCGGCKAVCSAPGACPPNVPTTPCVIDPCRVATCPNGTKCESNYCGGCNALCIRVNDTCPPGAPEMTCAPALGKPSQADESQAYDSSSSSTAFQTLSTPTMCCATICCHRCGFNATCVPDQCNNCAATCVKPCDAGYYINPDSPNGPECSKCKAGYKCPAGAPTPDPVPCNGGYYQDAEGRTSCKRCSSGTTTPREPSDTGYTSCY
eukprot:gene11488-biopygen13369